VSGVFLRAATAEDQATIRRIIRDARLNPFGLHWQRFIVAQAGEEVVGIGQVKILGDGTPELASLAVLPAYGRTGVGSALVWTLVGSTAGAIYLRCASHNESYYHRFGFRTLAPLEMPGSLRRMYRLANGIAGAINWVSGGNERLLIMGRW
jgi:N-acetylglutamate synthase-like GNAT family acetyltransferase